MDDSITEIGGKKHVILAAITFPDEDRALTEWLSQKSAFGLPPYQEVKWGNKSLSIEKRRGFVPILNKGTGIVVIYEGNPQAAALKLVEQVWSYSEQEKKKGFRVRFDKGIVQDWPELRKIAASYFPPCVGLSDHDSAAEQLVQCADFLAGSVKLKIDFGLGVRDQNQKIDDPEIGSSEIGFFFFAALRYCLWGEVKDYGDGIDTFMPLKHTRNKGRMKRWKGRPHFLMVITWAASTEADLNRQPLQTGYELSRPPTWPGYPPATTPQLPLLLFRSDLPSLGIR